MSIFKHRDNFRPFDYPQAYEFVKSHTGNPWSPEQIDVATDVQMYHATFTDAEKHGINTILKLFTTYEINVSDYWQNVVYKWFPPYEIRMMCNTFSSIEGVHAIFYDKLNDALGLSNKEFYLSYLDNPAMVARMDSIGSALKVKNKKDLPLSIAAFSFVEGVLLYSSFAYLLSFPKRNKLVNVANGIAYSIREEHQHASAGSWLFNTVMQETGDSVQNYKKDIIKILKSAIDLEDKLIDEVFSKGKIKDITDHQLKQFVRSRANIKLKDIGLDPIYDVKYNPIASWFYVDTAGGAEFSDFFATNSTSYTHKWAFGKIRSW